MALFVSGLLFCAFVVIVALCILLRELKQDIEEIEHDHRRLVEDLECEIEAQRKEIARLDEETTRDAERMQNAPARLHIFPTLFAESRK